MRPSRLAFRWRVFAPVAVVCVVALVVCAPAVAGTYVGGAMAIEDSASPPTKSSPYPSTVTVSGEQAIVTSVSVRVIGFTHDFPDEVDLLLVGPGGQTVLLISDAGADAETNENFTVRDDALGALPPGGGIGGTFKPTDIDDGPDVFPGPAPTGPFGTSLSALGDSGANGTWSLYAVDDSVGDAGSIAAWELRISSRDPSPIAARTEQLSPTFGFPENVGSIRVLVERFNLNLKAGSVSYWTAPLYGDPTPGQDYIPQSGRLEWATGDGSARAIDLPVIDDTVFEQTEAIMFGLVEPAGDVRLSRNPQTIVIGIADNEPVVLPPPLPIPLLGGAKVQRVLKQRGVIVTAKSNVAGAIVVTGRIVVPRRLGAIVRVKKVQRGVTAGQSVKVKLGLSRKALRKVRRALTIRTTLRATARLSVKDTLGRTKTTVKKLTLKR